MKEQSSRKRKSSHDPTVELDGKHHRVEEMRATADGDDDDDDE